MADELFAHIAAGEYVAVLTSEPARILIRDLVRSLKASGVNDKNASPPSSVLTPAQTAAVGLAALNAFLQLNVTGPVLEQAHAVESIFQKEFSVDESEPGNGGGKRSIRDLCLRSLDVDGVAVYPYIPSIEFFSLARHALITHSCQLDAEIKGLADPALRSSSWLRLRLLVWHHKLFIHPSVGAGSSFNKGSQWTDLPTLEQQIREALAEADENVLSSPSSIVFTTEQKVQFLLEKVNVYITLGLDAKAKEALAEASRLTGFVYSLSGALGKRTKFQENSTSQLVVLAKSAAAVDGSQAETDTSATSSAAPEALPLNDDTLLEKLDFTDANAKPTDQVGVPEPLRGIAPDNQPQLAPLDQIILLAEATLKDAFSPADSLTSEEILPFAERVVSDKSNNWQIYTQALLVRSRIEVHRSRTVERGILQMQAVVDQVLVDTSAPAPGSKHEGDSNGSTNDVPSIEISTPGEAKPVAVNQPTSFFPKADPADSAPANVRLHYVHALSSPPRWHLESELAFSWTSVGSIVAALDIFKRLRLWAEVALCLATAGAHGEDDEGGRGLGSEEKGRAVVRWRLFQPTAEAAGSAPGPEDLDVDVSVLRAAHFTGAERDPPPPNAPRLYCILGDLEQNSEHYERAWEISGRRYARAQRSLGEFHLQHKDWEKAREAYIKATSANRLSAEMWSRLGDINLRLGRFADAAEAFRRAIASASGTEGGEDARTWSNLGSALYSLHCEAVDAAKKAKQSGNDDAQASTAKAVVPAPDEEDDIALQTTAGQDDAVTLLAQALSAYKRGASMAHDNWRIWDNVVTLAARTRPPAIAEIIAAMRHILRVRATEDAVDADVLRLLLDTALLPNKPQITRGSVQKNIVDLFEEQVAPMVTSRSELWGLIGRERAWRGDYGAAIDAAEKGWRAAVGGSGVGVAGGGGASLLAPGAGGGESKKDKADWRLDQEAWEEVVARTDELVGLLENYGPDVEAIGTRWKGKAKTVIRSVLGKAKENWEGSEGWRTLEGLLEGLQS
ncbi:hypothetical protein ACKVWC_010290 [Pyricularia oryzae]